MSDGDVGDGRFVTTRKNHDCYYCEGTISAGTADVSTWSWVEDDSIFRLYGHEICQLVAWAMPHRSRMIEHDPDIHREHLQKFMVALGALWPGGVR